MSNGAINIPPTETKISITPLIDYFQFFVSDGIQYIVVRDGNEFTITSKNKKGVWETEKVTI